MAFVRFARSPFGGGWIVPDGEEATTICRAVFGEEPAPLAPLGGEPGYIVEPADVDDAIQTLHEYGLKVTL